MGCSLASKWERGRHQPPMQDCRCLAEKPGEQRHQQKANQGNTAASHELFHALTFCTRVVVSVTFQQVNHAPDTETSSKSNNESLKNINSRVKKFHRLNVAERKKRKAQCVPHKAAQTTGLNAQLSFQKF